MVEYLSQISDVSYTSYYIIMSYSDKDPIIDELNTQRDRDQRVEAWKLQIQEAVTR